jgi:hypothetical protein
MEYRARQIFALIHIFVNVIEKAVFGIKAKLKEPALYLCRPLCPSL